MVNICGLQARTCHPSDGEMLVIHPLMLMTLVQEVTSVWWMRSKMPLIQWSNMKDMMENSLSVTVHANYSSVLVLRDQQPVYGYEAGTSGEGGVHVLVMHASTGHVMMARHFRTYQPAEQHGLHGCLDSLQPGRLLVLLGMPPFMTYMWPEGVEALLQQGATLVPRVTLGELWVMVTLTGHRRGFTLHGGRVLAETVATREGARAGPALRLEVDVIMATEGGWCGREGTKHQAAHARFCDTYEGYGALCQCDGPYNPALHPPPASIPMTEDIPVVIVTANKPHYLYRILKNFRSVAGAAETKVLVVVDGVQQETLHLARLFQVETVVHTPQGPPGENTRTNMNVGFALYSVFERWPHVDKAILLEDDLLLAPDLLSYFHQAAPALTLDPTLYLVNAFGQNSYPCTARDPTTILRAEMYPQYGWMTTRRWVQHVLPLWVPPGSGRDWDWWVYTEGVRGRLEAVVPEVSRTAHGGAAGAHVTGWEQHLYFSNRLLTRDLGVTLQGVHRLVAENYTDWLEDEIRQATKLRLLDHPCHTHIVPKHKAGPFVLYLGVASRADEYNSFFLMQACLGTDDQEVKELYKGVIRLRVRPYSRSLTAQARLNNLNDIYSHTTSSACNLSANNFEILDEDWQILYLVGCPLSHYCKHSSGTSDWMIPGPEMLLEAERVTRRRRMAGVRRVTRVRVAATSAEEEFTLNNYRDLKHSGGG
ncbi:protein O-linked-mannose beta-1,2-N-acetylglucosaminyltransferase 1-like [Panulirus ornatus]|uniref:protein O-linked-mannose beta-1,2-N-acetylglucosaminyltransferase 1-like n=1 Tax=Panulirus ornatus TaxID=150431 RepID=UPI003A8BBC7C